MTSCLAVSKSAVVVSSIDMDKCLVYILDNGIVKNLTASLGEAYKNMELNHHDLQKACAAFSTGGELFAYNTNKGKLLSIWNTKDWSLIENKVLAKRATNIVFTPKTNIIIVGDKKGDVYSFEEQPMRIIGHSSMVLDICFSNDEKYIVTCDSDEKVRVSHYPNGKNILYYMMGHEEYVSGICMLNNFILSGSGDSTLRLWDFNNGDLLDILNLHSPIQSVVQIENVAAIKLHKSKEVHFVKTEKKENNWIIKKITAIKFENDVINLARHGKQLWINEGYSVHTYTIDLNDIIYKNDEPEILRTHNILNSLMFEVKSPQLYLKKTDLMMYLYNKMINKQLRKEKYLADNSITSYSIKRIKQH